MAQGLERLVIFLCCLCVLTAGIAGVYAGCWLISLSTTATVTQVYQFHFAIVLGAVLMCSSVAGMAYAFWYARQRIDRLNDKVVTS